MKVLNKLRLATWKIFQPLVIPPSASDSVVSDLFVWRNSPSFKTFFELTSIPSLFEVSSNLSPYVSIFIFNSTGLLIAKRQIFIESFGRSTLDISSLLPPFAGSFGTFAIFHSYTPDIVQSLGSFISERGYVGYSYESSPLLSYAHGNFDAIAYSQDSDVQVLGSKSLRRRSYFLQHLLTLPFSYDIVIVNTTNSLQVIRLDEVSADWKIVNSHKISLQSRGSHIFPIHPSHETINVVLHSKIIMSRPLVFRSYNSGLDVFHG